MEKKKTQGINRIAIIVMIIALIVLTIVGFTIYTYVKYGGLPSLTNLNLEKSVCSSKEINECKSFFGKTPVYDKQRKECTCEQNVISKTEESCATGYFWCTAPELTQTCLSYYSKALKGKCENNKCKFSKDVIYRTSIETSSNAHDGSTDGKDFIESDCSGAISGICSKQNLSKVNKKYSCSRI